MWEAVRGNPPVEAPAGRPGPTSPDPIERIVANRPYFSGKHKIHGVNLQVIASPEGSVCGSAGRVVLASRPAQACPLSTLHSGDTPV